MASTQATTYQTVTDVALSITLPVEVQTTTYTQDDDTPEAGTVTVAVVRVPAGMALSDAQDTAVFADVHTLLGWTS